MTIPQALQIALQHHQAGRLAQAEALYRQILAAQPDHPDSLHLLGVIAHQAGRHDLAVEWIRKAIAVNPADACYYLNLGNVLVDQGDLDGAIASYRRALHVKPDHAEAHNNLGAALRDRGQLDEAIAACRRALQLKPGYPEAHTNLGNALRDRGQWDEAIAECRRALAIKPDFPEAHNNLGNALKDRGQLDEAVAAYRRALQLRPGYPQAHNNLGLALKDQGEFDESIAAYRRALELKPEQAWVHSNLVYTLHFHPECDERKIAEERQRWNRRFSEPLKQFLLPHSNGPSPERRLRIGYISPDFREHVVGRYLLPLFERHDRQQFEILCYSGAAQPDAMTERFRALAAPARGASPSDADGKWRSTVGISDARLAEMVREDGVDILVDLTQHLAGNRLPVFARKPAPVQVSFAGYPESTGLEAIEYRISDRYLEAGSVGSVVLVGSAGEGNAVAGLCEAGGRSSGGHSRSRGIDAEAGSVASAGQHAGKTEHVYLIDSFWCYDPCGLEVAINPLPALKSGAVTFGCLNNFCKVNERALGVWARVLRMTKDSRLLISCAAGSHRRRTLETLERGGVAPGRVEFVDIHPRREYLELYHSLDIALDTFPYNGGVTTCDALWMGTPVVTLPGEMPVSRAGLSLLSNVGLGEWVASSEEDYVRIAVESAGDLPRLARLRSTLRDRMKNSVVMDAPRFARQVEQAYREMWRAWAAAQSSAPAGL